MEKEEQAPAKDQEQSPAKEQKQASSRQEDSEFLQSTDEKVEQSPRICEPGDAEKQPPRSPLQEPPSQLPSQQEPPESLPQPPRQEPPPESTDLRINRAPSNANYSIFTPGQKKCIIVAASFAALFSPMATAIYYPSLTVIANDLDVTVAQISITVTLFLVIQGIAPAFIADLSDKAGRRPTYIACYLIFSVANIALALQNNYVALLILRMLQAAGSSGTVALANGVVGDLVTSAERGTYIAFASVGTLLGPMVAPILGGVIGQFAGWHFIFWFLLIFSSAIFIPLILFMPETCRNIVDNGSIPPPLFSKNVSDAIRHRKGIPHDEEKEEELQRRYKIRLPNPFATLKVLLDPESAILLFSTGLGFGCFYAISTGASDAFSSIYGFDQVQVALIFIPLGAGSMVSAFSTGRVVDWNFARHCKKLGLPVIKNRRQDLTDFPIEKARLQVAFPIIFLGGIFIILYGWFLTAQVSIAGPVIALFFGGFGLTAVFQVLSVLMVDIYPGKPAVATAANNFVRCEIGAVFTAFIIPLIDAIGTGWAYTVLALLFMGFAPLLLFIMKVGPRWRREKKEKLERRRAEQTL